MSTSVTSSTRAGKESRVNPNSILQLKGVEGYKTKHDLFLVICYSILTVNLSTNCSHVSQYGRAPPKRAI